MTQCRVDPGALSIPLGVDYGYTLCFTAGLDASAFPLIVHVCVCACMCACEYSSCLSVYIGFNARESITLSF